MRRRALLAGTATSAALLQACATPRDMPFDAAMFPRTQPDAATPGRIAVQIRPELRDLVYQGEKAPARNMRVPIGRIAEQAVLGAATQAFIGGAALRPAGAAPDAGLTGTLVIQGLRLTYDSKLAWFIPLPYLGAAGDFEYELRLAIDISALDANGQLLWTRAYDDGRQLWDHGWTEQHKASDGLLRLTHEAAWRLAQRAVKDLRAWAETERLRERSV